MWYDLSGRLTGKQYRTDGSACSSKPADSPTTPNYAYFHYDESGHGESIGRLTSVTNNVLTIDTSYDVKGQITNTTYDYHLITGPNYSFGYSYTASGAPLSITYPDGEVLTYGYDNRGLLQSVYSSDFGDMVGGALDPVQYDSLGRTTSLPLQGFEITYTYKDAIDPSGMLRLDDILAESDSETTLLYLNFENYDKKGNLITVEDVFAGVSEGITYGYDNLSRLTSVVSTNGPNGAYNLAYTYDPYNGNLLTTTENDVTQTRSYGNANHPHAVTGYQGNTYTYDANGNMTTRTEDGIIYIQEWNAYNKLRKVTWTDTENIKHIITFGYDADGARVVKIHKTTDINNVTLDEKTTLYIGGVFEYTIKTTSYNYTNQFAAIN
jgi:YD repeat-containing protein